MSKLYELVKAEVELTENLVHYLHRNHEFEVARYLSALTFRLKEILEAALRE